MPIYLDHNGTTPMRREVCDELRRFCELEDQFPSIFGNASSNYCFGFQAKQKLEESRTKVAQLFETERKYVTFTSGGTEANNMVILGLAAINQGMTIISGPCEHPSVENPISVAKRLFSIKHKVVACRKDGSLDPEQVALALDETVFLVVTMLAQNEIGTLTDCASIYSKIQEFNAAHQSRVKFHVDACYAVGKVPCRFASDFMAFAGHKLYGPKGIGCLLQREELFKVFDGAGQEHDQRPGTENIMLISGLACACEVARADVKQQMLESARKTEAIFGIFRDAGLDFKVNGAAAPLLHSGAFTAHFEQENQHLSCLPNTLSVSFRNVPGSSVISALADEICISAGAACHSDRVEISQTLRAIGLDVYYAAGTLRISCGLFASHEECAAAARRIAGVVATYYRAGEPALAFYDVGNGVSERQSAQTAEVLLQEAPYAGNSALPVMYNNTATEQGEQPNEPQKTNLLLLTSGLGCACKLRPQALSRILRSLDFGHDPAVLIDQATNDDAAVVELDSNLLVSTVDFFSPVVDDAYLYGAIAAANAISDIYAMNAAPRVALALAGFPSGRLPEADSREIMRGAIDKCAEAGITICGGHTIESVEPFFGLAVSGVAKSREALRRNAIPASACENDVYLVLSKKLGVGMLTTALKRGLLQHRSDFQAVYAELIANMAALNVVHGIGAEVVALTDVTGFGLIGHLCEMLAPERLSAELFCREIPALAAARDVYEAYDNVVLTSENNAEYARAMGYDFQRVDFVTNLIADPTTSGGLLFAVKGWDNALRVAEAHAAAIVGHVFKSPQRQHVILSDASARENTARTLGIFK